MKRNSNGIPVPPTMMHRWSRPPLSCAACREKKRRCDRGQPCSNCVQRNISCEYPGQSPQMATYQIPPQSVDPLDMSQGGTQRRASGVQTVNQSVIWSSVYDTPEFSTDIRKGS
ncbi:unnamed protein product [Penicillium salamii]|nr:unnamed protein product [Penicillium salamii]